MKIAKISTECDECSGSSVLVYVPDDWTEENIKAEIKLHREWYRYFYLPALRNYLDNKGIKPEHMDIAEWFEYRGYDVIKPGIEVLDGR